MNKAALSLSLILVFALPAGAQIAGVPRLGWLPGAESRSARPVFGVPGSARVGGDLPLPESVRLLALHPSTATALVLRGDSQEVGWLRLSSDDEHRAVSLLPGAHAAPDLTVWSPSGRALLLAWREAQLAQVWTLNDETFTLLEEFPLAAQAAAVSDDGRSVLSLDGAALSLRHDGAAFVAAEPGSSAGFTFFPASASFAFSSSGQLVIHDGNAEVRRFPLLPEGQDDSRNVILVSPSAGRILSIQSGVESASSDARFWSDTGELIASSECPARVTSIRSVGQPGLLWLESEGDGPAWFADLSSSSARIFFVPPPIAAETTEGGDR